MDCGGLGAERVDGEVVLGDVGGEGLEQVVERLAHCHGLRGGGDRGTWRGGRGWGRAECGGDGDGGEGESAEEIDERREGEWREKKE